MLAGGSEQIYKPHHMMTEPSNETHHSWPELRCIENLQAEFLSKIGFYDENLKALHVRVFDMLSIQKSNPSTLRKETPNKLPLLQILLWTVRDKTSVNINAQK